ncbi:RagB/SusD family nutrient uptake outer membrane protein [Parapedobacter defluvii]|uniref:RagB/SusD family nutrient uptake outer membrane protein n=1 Tax=Parapedobacter defluvii TaxID=2045106 RepID=UPI003341D0AA
MEKLIKRILLPILWLIAGCDNFLDRSPYDQISSENAFTSASLAETVVNGAYSNLRYDYSNYDRDILNWDAFSSVIDPTDGYIYQNYAYLTGTIQPNNGSFLTYWQRLYEGVARANDVINNIGLVPDMSDELKSQRIAECKFLRAYHYYRLNSLWRGVPLYLENLSNAEYTRPRASEEEVWNAIIQDLTDCIENPELPGKYAANSSDYGRVTKAAAYTLRGKVYLWLKRWDLAEADFRKIGEMGYSLYTGSYADLFKLPQERSDEMIFSVQMDELAGMGNTFSRTYGNRMTAGAGNSSFFMNTRFVDSYEWANGKPFDWEDVIPGYNAMEPKARSVYFLRDNITTTEQNTMQTYGADMSAYLPAGNEARIKAAYADRDPRLEATAITPYATYSGGFSGTAIDYSPRWPFRSSSAAPYDLQTNSNTFMLYSIRKFVAEGREFLNVSFNPVDVPIFRYADVLLCLAEALNEQGKYQEAITFVNQVRNRATVAPLNEPGNAYVAVSSPDDLRPRIRNERKWELAGEEQLYYDELRWGTWQEEKFAEGNGLLEVWGAPVYTYQWGGTAYLKWPIPSSELERNTNLVQNEGW